MGKIKELLFTGRTITCRCPFCDKKWVVKSYIFNSASCETYCILKKMFHAITHHKAEIGIEKRTILKKIAKKCVIFAMQLLIDILIDIIYIVFSPLLIIRLIVNFIYGF